jgi:hypothetical protein
MRRNTRTGAGAASSGVRRCYEWIGAVVDVEESTLSALEEEFFIFTCCLVELNDSVRDKGPKLVPSFAISIMNFLE